MENLQAIQEKLDKIDSLRKNIENTTIDDLDVNQEEIYDEFLDECYESIKIGNIEFYPSRVLKELDPIAYNCGKADYFDSCDITDFKEYEDFKSEIEEQIDELKQEIIAFIEEY